MNQNFCPIHAVKRLLGGKWKIPLMFKIQGGEMCFRQLKRALDAFTEQMLTKQLRELEKYTPGERKDYKTAPSKIECSLPAFRRSFKPIISQFQELGKNIKRRSSLLLQLGECLNYKSIYAYIF